ncbi:MAG: hypothetical protein ABIZ80_23685 [Bryobacteraceae bacterium]
MPPRLSAAGLVAALDATAAAPSHLFIFTTDQDGNLSLRAKVDLPTGANGVALVQSDNDKRGDD